MRPLIGVNYNCHGKYYVSQNDSIARAVRQVEYVVARGFRGAFYYIGNEDGANVPAHTEQIASGCLVPNPVHALIAGGAVHTRIMKDTLWVKSFASKDGHFTFDSHHKTSLSATPVTI